MKTYDPRYNFADDDGNARIVTIIEDIRCQREMGQSQIWDGKTAVAKTDELTRVEFI